MSRAEIRGAHSISMRQGFTAHTTYVELERGSDSECSKGYDSSSVLHCWIVPSAGISFDGQHVVDDWIVKPMDARSTAPAADDFRGHIS